MKVHVVATDSAVAALLVAIAVTLMCTSLFQHCHYHCCHTAVLVFAATALCSFLLLQCCVHRLWDSSCVVNVFEQSRIYSLIIYAVLCYVAEEMCYDIPDYKFFIFFRILPQQLSIPVLIPVIVEFLVNCHLD